MLHLLTSIKGHPRHDKSFFKDLLHNVAFKVSNDLDKYLPRHNIFKNCLESDVLHMTLQISLTLTDFNLDGAFFVPIFRLSSKS